MACFCQSGFSPLEDAGLMVVLIVGYELVIHQKPGLEKPQKVQEIVAHIFSG